MNRTAPAARQILSYFVRNPSAADSLEGIAKWRLLEEAIYRNVLETKEALEWLVQEGFLVETAQPHSGHTFRLNAERRMEARSFLEVEQQQPDACSNDTNTKD